MVRKRRPIKRQKDVSYLNAVWIGIGIAVALMFITPRCETVQYRELPVLYSRLDDPEIKAVVDSLRGEGYAVENHYPVYIRFVKDRIDGDPNKEAMRIARAVMENTGERVKIQLDFSTGKVYADPVEGLIDPMDFMEEVELEENSR